MEVLSRKLEDTHDEIQRVRCEVVEALKAFYGGASSLSAEEAMKIASKWSSSALHSTHPHAGEEASAPKIDRRVDRLAHALEDVVGQLQLDDGASSSSSGGAQTRLISSFAQRERLKRQMDQSRRMLQVVEKVTQLDNLLFEIDACMDKGDVIGAADASVRAQARFEALNGLKQDSTTAPASENDDILRILKLQLLKKQNRLLHVLDQAHGRIMSAKPGALRTKKPSFHVASTSPGAAKNEAYRKLWRASDLLGILPARSKEIARVLSQHLLKPLFASEGAFVKVVAVIQFLHTEMLASDAEIMHRVGEFIWKSPGNLESQLLSLLQDNIPKDTSAINAYRDAIGRMIHELGSVLEPLGFIIPKNSQLRNFGSQINLLYAKKRRQQLLTIARGFMSREYRNSTKVTAATERCNIDASIGSGKKGGGKGKAGSSGGSLVSLNSAVDEVESGSFQMPDYRVTHCAHDIVELAHQTLLESCTPDSVCANTLFHTSRDILFLFRAVVPTLYQSEIANDASTCMLFHNDCMYIAHHMLTIGHLYKSRLSSPLSQIATMVDMVPAFRETGESALTAYAKTISDDLRAGTKAFQEKGGVESNAALEDLEQFFKSTLYKLNHITMSWRDGLPNGVYNQVLRSILHPFVTNFLEQMLTDKKIGASVAGKIHNLASLLLETQAAFGTVGQAEKYVPSLGKLRRFTTLLVQPLITIQDQYLNGDLGDFSTQELSSLVRSLFRDSPERKELLRLFAMPPSTGSA